MGLTLGSRWKLTGAQGSQVLEIVWGSFSRWRGFLAGAMFALKYVEISGVALLLNLYMWVGQVSDRRVDW